MAKVSFCENRANKCIFNADPLAPMPNFSKFGPPFDGFCDKPPYQMVPARDMRRLQFSNNGPDCEIYIDDPSVAGIANFVDASGRHLPTSAPIVDSFVVPKNGIVSFTVNGRGAGRTFLLFHNDSRAGNPNKGIEISVKGRRTKSVSLLTIADTAGHKGSLSLAEVNKIFDKVRKYFLDECNLELQAGTPHKLVTVQKPLSGTVVWDKAKGGVGDILDILMAVGSDAAFAKSSDIVVLFMWDISSQSDVGVDTLAVCLPLSLWKQGQQIILFDDSQDAYVLAHEFGHALGLKHNLRSGSLMNAFTTSLSSTLEQFEIDSVNDDGT